MPVGKRVAVIGGGMTAIDVAVQSKLLGAEEVTILYRRGQEDMGASAFEQDLATSKGVVIRHNAMPVKVKKKGGKLAAVVCEKTATAGGKLKGTGETFEIACDTLFKAIGQTYVDPAGGALKLEKNRIVVDDEKRTSLKGVWAGGDCIFGGKDLTVASVDDGRRAAESIHASLVGIGRISMANLATNFLGIKSPNPFWLASAPPTDKAYNVERAFKAGWGGVVWKTLGEEGPPVVNVNGPRYGAIWGADRRLLGLNNIELITDRDIEINLQRDQAGQEELAGPRADRLADGALRGGELAQDILKRVEETDCDGVELNFGCPHGMSERGMGGAVGQVPEYIEMVARWCKAHTRMPVIVKLTPNITDVRKPARAAFKGRRGCGLADQHDQLDHLCQSRHILARAVHRRQGLARRLLRPGGEADRAVNGVRNRPRSRKRAACRSPASAASPPGATRRSSSPWAAARCRSARRR